MSDEMLNFNKVIQAIEFQGKIYSVERLTPDGLLELQRALRVAEKALAQPVLSDERIQEIADDIMGCSAMRAYRLQFARAIERLVRGTP
jgi:hypothetical protein